MSFEANVIATAKRFLKENETVEFTAGTLFAECCENTSRQIFSELFVSMNGKVQVSRTRANEFAYDFVA